MKKTVLILITVLVAVNVLPQERRYEKAMNKAMEEMQEASDPERYIIAAVEFQEITASYPDRWMPDYYAAQILTLASLEEMNREQFNTLQ